VTCVSCRGWKRVLISSCDAILQRRVGIQLASRLSPQEVSQPSSTK
jgi:hypothetical protein